MAMTVTNTKGMKAPTARNWVSNINQNRARDVQNMKERQTTKYARLQYTNKTGTNKIIPGNSGDTTSGTYAPRNVFDKATGLVATYSTQYTPIYIKLPQVIATGTDVLSTNVDKEWIEWKGINQLVEIEGTIMVSVATAARRVVRLQLFVNNLIVNVQLAVIEPIDEFGSGTGQGTREISVKHRMYLDSDNTVKLMMDRTDAEDININGTFFTASLSVKSIPMS